MKGRGGEAGLLLCECMCVHPPPSLILLLLAVRLGGASVVVVVVGGVPLLALSRATVVAAPLALLVLVLVHHRWVPTLEHEDGREALAERDGPGRIERAAR